VVGFVQDVKVTPPSTDLEIPPLPDFTT
jgi:hypothetical protein